MQHMKLCTQDGPSDISFPSRLILIHSLGRLLQYTMNLVAYLKKELVGAPLG